MNKSKINWKEILSVAKPPKVDKKLIQKSIKEGFEFFGELTKENEEVVKSVTKQLVDVRREITRAEEYPANNDVAIRPSPVSPEIKIALVIAGAVIIFGGSIIILAGVAMIGFILKLANERRQNN